ARSPLGGLFAQEFRSTITGRVVDAQQAAIGNADVTATHRETGAVSRTQTATDGQFTIPFLAPGPYTVAAQAAGFKRYSRQGLRVEASERVRLDILLEVGQASESITVEAEAPLLTTDTAANGQVINSRQVENMPMKGRNPYVLSQLAFGVIPTGDPQAQRPYDSRGAVEVSMAGAPSRTNEILLDGAANSANNNGTGYNPPIDTIAEVRTQVFLPDAAYGHTGGGTINLISKSGTNQLHGSLYEFNQTSALAATQFFTNRAGQKKPVSRWNQWGGTVGGPIVRNRLFFFAAYEGVNDTSPSPFVVTVPTEAQKRGDFSRLLALGPAYQVYDPASGTRSGTQVQRTPFAGNLIPASRFSAVTNNYLTYLPSANLPGAADGSNNFAWNGRIPSSYHNVQGRLDFNWSDRHKLFFSTRTSDWVYTQQNFSGNIATGNGLNRYSWGSTLDDVYSFSPTLLLNTRFSWTRFAEIRLVPSSGFDFTKLGFPQSLASASTYLAMPVIQMSNFMTLGANSQNRTPDDVFQAFSALTKVRGSHSLKVGADVRLFRQSAAGYLNSAGNYVFGTNWTNGPMSNNAAAPIGQEFASFLLGLPTGGSFDVNSARTNQSKYFALFLQDDFRIRPNLTFNLGIRYERDLPTRERYNRSVRGFDFATLNPVSAAAAAAYNSQPIPEIPAGAFKAPGGLLFAGDGTRDVYSTNSTYFSPRFGFAWTPGVLKGKTVVRGGTGVFVFPIVTTGVNGLGFSSSTPVTATLDNFLTPAATLSNPFPGGLLPATGSSRGLGTFVGNAITFYNPSTVNPYSIRWSLNLQHELPGRVIVEAGYVGNHAIRLPVDMQLNFLPRQYQSTLATRDGALINFLNGTVSNPFAGLAPRTTLNGGSIARSQLLLPYPQFTSVTAQALNIGSSYFHMFEFRAEKRYSNGLQMMLNFQHSRLMERRTRMNLSDPFLEKRVAAEDRPNRLVVGGNWDLPIGRGLALAPNAPPVLNHLIGGWSLNAFYFVGTGAPLAWGNVVYLGGNLNPQPRNVDLAFDTTRFNRVAGDQPANNIRTFPTLFNSLRASGQNSMDASIIKAIQ
ncbi:MAG: TonB-dependent receptor, partial [Acidobacteria bacterium]|nr:TonB-dependent receptor [Acidobacteriota bacterium]